MSWSIKDGGVWCCTGPAEELCIGHQCAGISGTVFRCGHCGARIIQYENGAIVVEHPCEADRPWKVWIRELGQPWTEIGAFTTEDAADDLADYIDGPVQVRVSKDSPTTVTDPDKVQK